MKKFKSLRALLALVLVLVMLVGCTGNIVENANTTPKPSTAAPDPGGDTTPTPTDPPYELDLSKNIPINIIMSMGNKSRTITYNQEAPLTLPDGTNVTAGMLKPVWQHVEKAMNITISDKTVQDQKANEMIKTMATNGFADAHIIGGNSIAADLMYYGTEGKFVNITEAIAKGYMPNFGAYLEANPDIKSAITAYDGNIYHIPYIAEVGSYARVFNIRQSWVTRLLDEEAAALDTNTTLDVYYNGYYTGENARTGANGGTVEPKTGVKITKKTGDSIIQIQNALEVKNGATLTKALVDYIRANYDYAKPSELFLGEKAAYDIDELIALMRCIKANPGYLTEGKADTVWPLFTRQSSYREDLLRMSTYFGGIKCHSADSYGSRWYIDADGQVQYTYASEGMFEVLTYLSQMEAEGLIYSDCYDLSNKANHRTTLWGTDASETPTYGFMVFDWKASSTSDSLNTDTVVILPPVAKINGAWQYFIDNGRAIKPDGWAISVAACKTEEELQRACAVADYFFSEEGATVQNYGLPYNLVEGEQYVGPDGISYPKFNQWLLDTAAARAKGDVSVFLRDYMGGLISVGFQKNIGFEYQYTSERGFDGWALLNNSTCHFATYSGEMAVAGDNPNYGKMVPPVFSLTQRQMQTIADSTTMEADDLVEDMFNIIRYAAKGNAPDGIKIPANYEEYAAAFEARNLDAYVKAYQAAYAIMTSGK